MEHGRKELEKLLNIFDNMTEEEYLQTYEKSLLREDIKIITDISKIGEKDEKDI